VVLVKKIRYASVIIIILLLSMGSYYFYSKSMIKQWDNKIYPTIYINDINASGKTKEEIYTIIEENISYLMEKKINIKHKDKMFSLQYAQINPSYNIEEIVNEAYNYGKGNKIFENLRLIKKPVEKRYYMKFDYDKQALDKFLDDLEKSILVEAKSAGLEMVSPGSFKVKNEILGERLKKDEMRAHIISKINDSKEKTLEVDAITEIINPGITAQELRKVNSLISSFSTTYNSNNYSRAKNVEIATKAINGALIMPGESFSFNERTGVRTAEKGYQVAPVIVKNKLEDGLGGGVCQVSSTLYNAVIRANLRSIERRNHSLAPAYIAPGYDATVSENIDYKFKNTLEYPVYIEGYIKNSKVNFNVYSDATVKDTEYTLVNEIYEQTPAETQIIEDPTLLKGTSKEETSHIGYKVKVYLVAKKGGAEIWKEVISKDVYKKVDGIIRIGISEY
jgi:vancomycin resistance protein YoaR